MRTFRLSSKDTRRPHKIVCDTFAPSSVLLRAVAPPNTLPSCFPPAFLASVVPSFIRLSGSFAFRCLARTCPHITAPVVKISSHKYKEVWELSLIVESKSGGKSSKTVLSKTKRKISLREHSQARAQAIVPQEVLPLPSTSPADVLKKYHQCEKLEAVRRSVLKFCFWLLKIDTTDAGTTNVSSSGSKEPIFSCHSGCLKDEKPRKSKAAQEKHYIKSTHFDDVVGSAPPLSCRSFDSPEVAPFFCIAFFSLFSTQTNRNGLDKISCKAQFLPTSSTFLPGIAASSNCNKIRSFTLS